MVTDLIILIVIFLSTIIGYKQGLVKAALKILTFFIAFIITISIYKPVSAVIINKTNIDEKIEQKITARIIPKKVEERMEVLPNSIIEAGQNTVQELAKSISEKIISAGVFIVLFFSIKIILKFVTILADLITKLPIIKQFDKTGGIIYGFVKGMLFVLVVFAIIYVASPLVNIQFINTINSSIIGSYLYNHNFLIGFIK